MKDIRLDGTLIECKSRNNLGQETSVEQAYCTDKATRALTIFSSIVRPTVAYGVITWFQKVTQVTTRNTPDKLQRLARIRITRAMRTCPIAALEVILDLWSRQWPMRQCID
ncbi:hypothetical protein Trydic_g23265 [Trypoxylus dichotomus]